MYLFGLIVLVCASLITGLILDGGSTKNVLTTETIVKRHGYPFETHTVQTDDGYLLGLHRIPCSSESTNSSQERSPVAFLFHCLLCSSSDWVVTGPGNSLAYTLSDAGYDVWMGNARGNTYSRNHTSLNPDGLFNGEFWNFSWHEIGIIDLPNMIDYVLNFTETKQITYIGHSQGSTTFMVLNSMRPEYNIKFKSAHLASPVAYLSNSNNTFSEFVGPILGRLTLLQSFIGNNEFRPSKELQFVLGKALCPDSSEYSVLCENSLFQSDGFTNETVNSTIIPDIMASTPAGSSVNQLLHYLQLFVSGYFRQIDHGLLGNIKAYGSSSPPEYPLENINATMFLYHSVADSLAAPKDVEKLIKRLKTLAGTFLNTIYRFDHLAHMYSPNLGEKLHKHIMKDIESVK